MSVLFIGLASDGVDNQVREYSTIEDVEDFLHTKYSFQKYLSPGATTVTLSPKALATPDDKVNGYERVLLFKSLNASGDTLSFVWIGGDQEDQLVELSYTPYYGVEDLAVALKRSIRLGIKTYGIRLGGVPATLTVGGFSFVARTSGVKYNNSKISIVGSNVTFYGMDPDYPSTVVTYSSKQQFLAETNELAEIGVIPCYCTEVPNSLSNATGSLSGGTDGDFSSSLLSTCFNESTFPPDVEVVVILGATNAAAQSVVDTFAEENPSLTFFLNAGEIGTDVSAWAGTFYSDSVKSDSLFFFGNNIYSTDEAKIERSLAEAASLSYLSQNRQISLSNLPLKNSELVRDLSQEELDILYQAGVNASTRRIYSGSCLYKTVNGGNIDATKRLAASRIAQITGPYLYSFIGNPLPSGRNLIVEEGLRDLLKSNLPEDITYINSSAIVAESTLSVEMRVTVYDEILEIKFGVNF